ncbi:MAG: hypothetical protein IIV87_01675 [Oscillospiraceae bacterium]|nr:hypothetical protein [Oscillospiraceae bacterium]
MKKLLFLLITLLALSACASNVEPAPTMPQAVEQTPSVSVEEPQDMPQTPEETELVSVSWECAVQEGYFDEVCTYNLSVPIFQTENAEKINAFYEDLADSLKTYTSSTVYDTAQGRNCVASVTGDFSVLQENDVVSVDYTLSVSYSDETEPQIKQRTDTFDLTTGEYLEN